MSSGPEDETLDQFYNAVDALTTATDKLSPAGKVVALFRVAVEHGFEALGMIGVLHLLTRLMAATLGIMELEDEIDTESYTDILNEFDPGPEAKH
jgi:hypothetical protein|tara:strand:+ start:657 stop:941 length:285 start_codon:yes stop_codon:yes gene_type:complete